ncbi:MAG: 4'-phosphopantetheinyl transferase superfamily protein [Sphingobacteriaceae bacterium]|nr:4'-phosphopantetheinyl transferase superfamily protein [Sphingobacteriaceae bacterium]
MPIILKKTLSEDCVFGIWKIEESSEELTASLQLNAEELNTLAGIKSESRLKHWLAVRVLLRSLLATDAYIVCENDADGKPFLPDYKNFISFSHSGDYAAVMLSKKQSVGIDIEQIKHRIKGVKHKFLTDLELAQKQIGDNTCGLYVCWCAKEAIYKWYGKKGLDFKQHIHIKPFKLKKDGALEALVILPSGTETLQVNYFKTSDDYMVAYLNH